MKHRKIEPRCWQHRGSRGRFGLVRRTSQLNCQRRKSNSAVIPVSTEARPVIQLEPGNLYEIAERVTALLVAAKRIYRRDRHLIYTYDLVFGDDPKVYVQAERLKIIKLRVLIGEVARFKMFDECSGGYLPIEPPKSVASIIARSRQH
jgi:hypothetical protein